VVAKVVFLDKPQPAYYLQNVSMMGMQVRNPGAGLTSFQSFPLGAKLLLVSGLELQFGPEPEAFIGRVEAFHHG
jgi:hypothetical protein